jgi:Mor family transcriptional regulator
MMSVKNYFGRHEKVLGGESMGENETYKELEELIGTEAANRLVDHYSGSSIYIPQRIVIMRQHQEIRKEFKNGASYRELALRYDYTETHVRRIVHKKKAKDSSNKLLPAVSG